MTEEIEKILVKRFRNFCRRRLRGKVGVFSASPFFDRIYGDVNAKLEPDDFMHKTALGTPAQPVETAHTAYRFGRWPFHRYYLVATRIEGSIREQMLTYVMYEHRFSGLFATRRKPRWRRRTLSVTVNQLAISYEQVRWRYQDGVDTGWTGRETREDIVQVIEAFAPRLGF